MSCFDSFPAASMISALSGNILPYSTHSDHSRHEMAHHTSPSNNSEDGASPVQPTLSRQSSKKLGAHSSTSRESRKPLVAHSPLSNHSTRSLTSTASLPRQPSPTSSALSDSGKTKRVLSHIPEEERIFLSKYSYDESLIPTALKQIPVPTERNNDFPRHVNGNGGGDNESGNGQREGAKCRKDICCSCDNAVCNTFSDRESGNSKHKSRSLFFPNACETGAFSSPHDVVPNAMTKIDKISNRLYSRLPELIIRRQEIKGCCSDCILCCDEEENGKDLPDSCRCFVHSLKGRSPYSVRNYGEDDCEDLDAEALLYNNMSYSYFSSFWPNCRICPTWAPCSCRPGAEGKRLPSSSSSSSSSSASTPSESGKESMKTSREDLSKELGTGPMKDLIEKPDDAAAPEASADAPEITSLALGDQPEESLKSKKSLTFTSPEEIESRVDDIAAAVSNYAHEIFTMPEFAAETVEDLPDPKVFLTEDGQLRTRFSLTKDRIKIDNLEVTEPLASAVKSYVESFEDFCEFLEEIPSPQLFLDHDGIVRSGAELLANRRRIHRYIIERVAASPTLKDYANTELIHQKLKGLKLVQAIKVKRPELDDIEKEVYEEMEKRKIDPKGFVRDTARFNPGLGGFDAPPIRKASDIAVHDLNIDGRYRTRFFRVTRGTLAEEDHKWTPDQGDSIAFVLRYPESGPREEDIMELMAKLQKGNEGEAPVWKVV